MRQLISILFCGFLFIPCVYAAQEVEVDYLSLAALMLRDGNLDRALIALDQVNLEEQELDLARYYTLRGMTHLRRHELEPARDALLTATRLPAVVNADGEEKAAAGTLVFVYLAQVQFQLEDWQAALDALNVAGEEVDRIASVYHMRAQCHWLLDQPVMAIANLDAASEAFPDDVSFLRRKVFFLVDLGLFREASSLGKQYLRKSEGRLEDYVALGNALRASGELDEAALLLEEGKLHFPDSAELRKVLAHVYIDRNEMSAAADLLYSAALLEPGLMGEAAELYRRAGQAYWALALNSQLTDQLEKYRQRLALYLQLSYFEQAAAMEPALRRVGLLEEEDLRYAMAYALFKTGDFSASERHLSTLNRPDLFRKAAELRRAIQDCVENTWQCL